MELSTVVALIKRLTSTSAQLTFSSSSSSDEVVISASDQIFGLGRLEGGETGIWALMAETRIGAGSDTAGESARSGEASELWSDRLWCEL